MPIAEARYPPHRTDPRRSIPHHLPVPAPIDFHRAKPSGERSNATSIAVTKSRLACDFASS